MGLEHLTIENYQKGKGVSGTAAGTNTYTLTLTPAITGYALYQTFNVLFTNANTAAATLNIDGQGDVDIKRNGDKDTKEGDIKDGQVLTLMYDGTNFQIIGVIQTDWAPTSITLGSGITSGTANGSNIGAGHYISFESGDDDEFLINVGLEKNGIPYDGSDIIIQLKWMRFGGTASGNVIWELDYLFSNDGVDAYDDLDGTVSLNLSMVGVPNQELRTDNLPAVNGSAGSKTLQLTLRRNGAGGGSDTYSGDAELYGINLI